MSPARGPRSVLWVVLVTTWAWGTGDGVDPPGHEPREMRHVHQEEGTDLVGNGAERREVDDPGISAPAGDDELRLLFLRLVSHLVVVDAAGGGVHAVLHRLPDGAAVVDRRPVGEMAAMGQREAHDRGARRDQGHERREVGLCPGVRLHVGVGRAEELLQAVDGELLDFVHHLASAVIALPGITLGVLVGQRSAHGVDHRPAREVLAGDQL